MQGKFNPEPEKKLEEEVNIGEQLSIKQKELLKITEQYQYVLREKPRRAAGIEHKIITPENEVLRE